MKLAYLHKLSFWGGVLLILLSSSIALASVEEVTIGETPVVVKVTLKDYQNAPIANVLVNLTCEPAGNYIITPIKDPSVIFQAKEEVEPKPQGFFAKLWSSLFGGAAAHTPISDEAGVTYFSLQATASGQTTLVATAKDIAGSVKKDIYVKKP